MERRKQAAGGEGAGRGQQGRDSSCGKQGSTCYRFGYMTAVRVLQGTARYDITLNIHNHSEHT